MLSTDILSIAQEHTEVKALSVYLPIDPDESRAPLAASIALRNGLAAQAQRLRAASHSERTNFESCASRLVARLNALGKPLSGRVWIAFALATGELYDVMATDDLPTGVGGLVTWDLGMRIAPLLALAQSEPATLVLADHQHAAFFRVEQGGELRELMRFETLPRIETGAHTNAPAKVSFHPGTHGTSATDSAARQANAAYTRHRGLIVTDLSNAVNGGAIYLAGATETASHIYDALPPAVRSRATIVRTIHFTSTAVEIQRELARVQRDARDLIQRRLVSEVLARARSTRVGVLGQGPTRVAIEQCAVEALVLSADLLQSDADEAERLVRDSLQQHAVVHVVTGDAARALDSESAGVAARLRFPISPPAVAARA